MTLQESIEVLKRHQEWRLGNDNIEATTPKKLTESIDTILSQFPQQEISDEEIEKWVASTPYYGHCTTEYREGLEEGAKWYREQLKTKKDKL